MRKLIALLIILLVCSCSKDSSILQPTQTVPEFQRAYTEGYLTKSMLWGNLQTIFYIDTELNFENVESLQVWSKIDSQVLTIIPSRLESRMSVITFPKTRFVDIGSKFKLILTIHNIANKKLHNQGEIE